ncbi:MAG: VanZ family protein [Elusimicrobiota bacterium]|nr:VanZ family protein [Elusimicrobiota bacterium]
MFIRLIFIRETFRARPRLAVLWALSFAAIPLTSYFGRGWQRSLTAAVGKSGVLWIMAAAVAALLVSAALHIFNRAGWKGLLHLLWIVILAGGLMYALRAHPERWLHIPLFAMLGFFSVSLFDRTGAEFAMAYAFLDELFQYYHPERVGDFADVIVNAVCAAAGIILFLLIAKAPKKG